MDLTSPKTIKELLKNHETRASKGLGQNFLIDRNVLEKIIKSAELNPDDTVLEIGPGIGTLTQELAESAGKVIAIEKDKKMVAILAETLKDCGNVEIINADALKFKADIKKYKVVANIPYYITSPLIRKFLETENQPEFLVLMVQKEVAQRICSRPPDMSLLSVSVQFYAEPKIVSMVLKNCFWPAPKVDSAILKITPKNVGLPLSPELFFKIVKAGFTQPRKQLVNNLTTLKSLNGVKLDKYKTTEWLLKNNLKPNQRAETLKIDDWINLTKSLNKI